MYKTEQTTSRSLRALSPRALASFCPSPTSRDAAFQKMDRKRAQNNACVPHQQLPRKTKRARSEPVPSPAEPKPSPTHFNRARLASTPFRHSSSFSVYSAVKNPQNLRPFHIFARFHSKKRRRSAFSKTIPQNLRPFRISDEHIFKKAPPQRPRAPKLRLVWSLLEKMATLSGIEPEPLP
jgi:hypothetical protein